MNKMEARVVCVANKVTVQDLMLTLHRGAVEFLPEARARASADLGEAERMGLITVQYIKRFREVRTNAQPLKQAHGRENSVAWNRPPQRLLRRGALVQPAAPPKKETQPPATPAVDEAAVRAVVAEELQVQLQGMKKDLIGHLVAHMDDLRQDVRVLFERSLQNLAEDVVRDVVRGVETRISEIPAATARLPVRQVEGKKDGGWGFEDEEDLVFIPQGIVSESGPRLEVASEVSETPDNLDDAAAALRSLKRRKKAEPPSGQEEIKK